MNSHEIRSHVVRRDDSDPRDWLAQAPICDGFAEYHIAHCGIMQARDPLTIFRDHLSGTFFLACVDGAGEVLIDGQWQRIQTGQACIQPPFMTNGLRTLKKTNWTFCWVRYKEPAGVQPVASTQFPSLGAFNSEGFQACIHGVSSEATSTTSAAILRNWVEMLHRYVLTFVEPFRPDDRLQRIWDNVQRNPGQHWTLQTLAKSASMSKEHLRRLTHQALGRSPMQQVTLIRLRHAAERLTTSEEKVSVIAGEVGYDNPFAFSDTFARWIGFRPSEYRKQSRNKQGKSG
ncbi:MAG TPA: AraC family transcriptional regulator [Planctomicrobium sp.]|nr:AraC family transcriptional regulator [Planctomicrobium sp.]